MRANLQVGENEENKVTTEAPFLVFRASQACEEVESDEEEILGVSFYVLKRLRDSVEERPGRGGEEVGVEAGREVGVGKSEGSKSTPRQLLLRWESWDSES